MPVLFEQVLTWKIYKFVLKMPYRNGLHECVLYFYCQEWTHLAGKRLFMMTTVCYNCNYYKYKWVCTKWSLLLSTTHTDITKCTDWHHSHCLLFSSFFPLFLYLSTKIKECESASVCVADQLRQRTALLGFSWFQQ